MDETALTIEKIKASMETHKAYIIYWQTQILSGVDKSEGAHQSLKNHVGLVRNCAEGILEIEISTGYTGPR